MAEPWEEYQAPAEAAPWQDFQPTAPPAAETDGPWVTFQKALAQPSPEWLRAPEAAARELIGGMLPHDVPSYLESIYLPARAAKEAVSVGGQIAQGDFRGVPLVGRVQDIIEAEKTPAFSKERYLTGAKTLMDIGLLAGLKEPAPLRTRPLMPEPPPTVSTGPGTIAADVSAAVEKLPPTPTVSSIEKVDPDVIAQSQKDFPKLPYTIQSDLQIDARGVVEGAAQNADKYFDAHAPTHLRDFHGEGQQLYDTFEPTRDVLRQKYGDNVTLYRAQGAERVTDLKAGEFGAKNVLNYASRELAEKYLGQSGKAGRQLASKQVPVDDIVAVYSGKGGDAYIVLNRDSPNLILPDQLKTAPARPEVPTVRTAPPTVRPEPEPPPTFSIESPTDAFGTEQTPLANFIMGEAGKLMSPSAARRSGLLAKNPALWEDAPRLAHPTHNKIYASETLPVFDAEGKQTGTRTLGTGGETPDTVAAQAYDAGLIPDNSVTSLWETLGNESTTAQSLLKGQRSEAAAVKAQASQFKKFAQDQRAVWKADAPLVAVKDLQIGDTVTVKDQPLKVTDIDPDSFDVTLEDGTKYGVQTVKDNSVIYGQHKPITFDQAGVDVRAAIEADQTISPQVKQQLLSALDKKPPDIFTPEGDVPFVDSVKQPEATAPLPTDQPIGEQPPLRNKVEIAEKVGTLDNAETRLTSTKNAVVDSERTARGLSPIASEITQAAPETWALSEKKLADDPSYGQGLIKELNDGTKREVSEVDEAVLLREKVANQNAKAAEAERALDPNLTEDQRIEARRRYETLEAQASAIDQATFRSGQVWGRLGQFRQRLAADDYSLAALEKRLRLAKGDKPVTPEESAKLKSGAKRMANAQTALEKRNAALELAIARRKGLAPQRGARAEPPSDVETEILLTELKKLHAQSREANRLPGAKVRMQKRIKEIQDRINDYGFAKESKRQALLSDPELQRLRYELSNAKSDLDRGIFHATLKNRSLPKRIFQTGHEILAMPRAIMASMDLSAVRRQGGLLMMGNPIRSLRAFGPMLKAMKSDKGYFEVMHEIRSRPNAPLYQASKLALTDIEAPALSQLEEQYMSRWANSIPGINHSQRAYVAFLNRLRADTFDSLAKSLGKSGEVTSAEADAISNFVNVFTGRGAVGGGKAANAVAAMNDLFFAPRYVVSRFQALTGQPLAKAAGISPRVTKLIAQEYAKTLTGYGVMYGLIATAGKSLASVEFDPRSSDFGKIKIGNTRIDPLSGLAQTTTFLGRLAAIPLAKAGLLSGNVKTQKGEIKKTFGDVPYGATTTTDIMTNFLRSKLAPVPGGAVNYLQGKNVAQEPTPLLGRSDEFPYVKGIVPGMLAPLSGSDIYDAMKEQGVPAGAALGVLAMFGDGLQTYAPKVSAKQIKEASKSPGVGLTARGGGGIKPLKLKPVGR